MQQGSLATATSNGVYRTPGRAADAVRISLPSWRTLLGPLGQASALVIVMVAPVVVFNSWFVPSFVLKAKADVLFVPTFDFVQNGLVVLVLASLLLLLVAIVRQVRPSWAGLRLRGKLGYVATLLVVQSAVVLVAEYALFESRGGLHLFEPRLLETFSAPDGRTAFLYRAGLGCGYDVHVAEAYSFTMKKALHVARRSCDEPLPAMEWSADGSPRLVDPSGVPLESQPGGFFFRWGHC